MASIAFGARAQAADNIATRISTFSQTVVRRIGNWNRCRITRRELHVLSDRELNDIGLLRGDIDNLGDRTS